MAAPKKPTVLPLTYEFPAMMVCPSHGITVALESFPLSGTGSVSVSDSCFPSELATCMSSPSAGPDTTANPAVDQFVTPRAAFGPVARGMLRVTFGEEAVPVTPPKNAPIPPSDVKDSNLSEYACAVNGNSNSLH